MKNIFISSTFRDMQAERDLVQERVLPELRDQARKYGENVGVIDLRWGVDTSELETDEGSRKVLSVCLDEIERSHPYMLIFMGERYGWIPDSKMIQTAVEGKADKLILDDYEKSITALEIEFGALSETYGELDKCVVCMRSPLAHLIVDENERKIYLEENPKAAEKLRKLQERMREKLGDRIIEYTADWNEAEKVFENFRTIDGQALEEEISNAYLVMFEKDWEAYANLTWQQREQLEVQAVMESKLKSFRGREKLLAQYRRQLEENRVLILQGEVGSGKTSIMCKLMKMLEAEGKKVFRFISGNTVNSSRAFDLLKQMVWFMEEVLGKEEHFTDSGSEKDQNLWDMERETKKQSKYEEWKDYFMSLCFQLPKESEVYFCIDALDQLSKDEHLEKLDFLLGNRENIHFAASCTTELELPVAFVEIGSCVEQVPLLSVEDAMEVIEGLSIANSRNVYARIRTAMLQKKESGNPLYLSFLMQRLNMMDQKELREAVGEEEIVAVGVRVLQEVPESLEEAAVYVLEEAMERLSSEEETLGEILNLLAISRNGLRKEDLNHILSEEGKFYPALDMTRMMKYLEGFFVLYNDGRIDFGHKVIRTGLQEKITDAKQWQNKILDHLKQLSDTDGLRISEGIHFARLLEDLEFAKKLILYAEKNWQPKLDRIIIEEARDDFGEFYIKLIQGLSTETNQNHKGKILIFFINKIGDVLSESKRDIQIKNICNVNLFQYCYKIYQQEPTNKNLILLAVCYGRMGEICKSQKRYTEAKKYYEKEVTSCERIYEELGNIGPMINISILKNLLISYVHLAEILILQGECSEAEYYCFKSLECGEKLYISTGGIICLSYLEYSYSITGRMYERQKRYEEAKKYYMKSLQCAEKIYVTTKNMEKLQLLIKSYLNMGEICEKQKCYAEAEKYYMKSLEYAIQYRGLMEDLYSLELCGANYVHIGNLCKLQGGYEKAEQYYEKAIKCFDASYKKAESESSLVLLLSSCTMMGDICKIQCKYVLAENYYMRSLEYVKQLSNIRRKEEVSLLYSEDYEKLGDLFRMQGRYVEAKVHYEMAKHYIENRQDQINNNKQRYETILGKIDELEKREIQIVTDDVGKTKKDDGKLHQNTTTEPKSLLDMVKLLMQRNKREKK